MLLTIQPMAAQPQTRGFFGDLLDGLKENAMQRIDQYFNDKANLSDVWAGSFMVYYDSYDGQKNKVKLSAKVYYDKRLDDWLDFTDIKHILLSCHPTVTTNLEAPSGSKPLDVDVSRMVGADGHSYLIVCPDYCGYGVTPQMQHPYLIHDVTARNCVDAVLAAIEAAKKRGISISDDYQTDIIGYSQGGATALACAKYLESDACPIEIKQKIKLRQTACGDGPYSTYATVMQYMEWGDPTRSDGGMDLDYPCVLPLIVAAAKEAYNNGCMRTVDVEDFFTEDFLQTDIIRLLKTKSIGTDDLNARIIENMARRRPIDIFSEALIDKATGKFKEDSNLYKCLMRAMDIADLSKGWKPTHPIWFFHLKSDRVVPYSNLEAVKNGIMKDYPTLVHNVEPEDAHESAPSIVKSAKDLSDVKFDKVDHSLGGVIFYMDYMFGDKLHK